MVCDDVLKVKNLPKELSTTEKEDFLRHFGAVGIKVLTSNSKQTSVAYAKFNSKEVAKSVMLRLHQVTVLNCRLCIEYADHDITENQSRKKLLEPVQLNNKTHFKSFVNKLNALNSSVSFHQPPPPHLKYTYPNPNRATINNIAHALASVPKFYTQVLHLMNRMNLPPPFSNVPDPPQMRHRAAPNSVQVIRQEIISKQPKEDVETSESELESDSDSANKTEIAAKKRTMPHKKVVKRPKFTKPTVVQQPQVSSKTAEKPEDVFELNNMQQQKKIEVKISADSLEPKVTTSTEVVGSFGIMENVKRPTTPPDNNPEEVSVTSDVGVITEKELADNRIPTNDLSVVPVFKNYHPGAPTCRLYIKNIAKNVEQRDLEFIYKLFKEKPNGDEEKPSQFDIRLMQEGKMKGQAFITLDSVQIAQKALKETNGYILKNKPLVVVFARSALPKK